MRRIGQYFLCRIGNAETVATLEMSKKSTTDLL